MHPAAMCHSHETSQARRGAACGVLRLLSLLLPSLWLGIAAAAPPAKPKQAAGGGSDQLPCLPSSTSPAAARPGSNTKYSPVLLPTLILSTRNFSKEAISMICGYSAVRCGAVQAAAESAARRACGSPVQMDVRFAQVPHGMWPRSRRAAPLAGLCCARLPHSCSWAAAAAGDALPAHVACLPCPCLPSSGASATPARVQRRPAHLVLHRLCAVNGEGQGLLALLGARGHLLAYLHHPAVAPAGNRPAGGQRRRRGRRRRGVPPGRLLPGLAPRQAAPGHWPSVSSRALGLCWARRPLLPWCQGWAAPPPAVQASLTRWFMRKQRSSGCSCSRPLDGRVMQAACRGGSWAVVPPVPRVQKARLEGEAGPAGVQVGPMQGPGRARNSGRQQQSWGRKLVSPIGR